ncbi:MAG: WecB/TagA/CpsF family glycosyltransferase [Solirubrobacteraceae bacterium]|nr:WecB/TagA/CpsF family glycosyltransferase [Solirubrobacteraceae bacterium]
MPAPAPVEEAPWRDPAQLPSTRFPGTEVRTRALLGLPVAVTDHAQVLDWIDARVQAARERRRVAGPQAAPGDPARLPNGDVGRRGRVGDYICVTAVHSVMTAQEQPALKAAICESSFAVPDGQPVAWGLKALGEPIERRVYGPDLMAYQAARAAQQGHRWFLYGGRDDDPQSLQRLIDRLKARHPELVIAGSHRPVFRPLTPAEQDEVVEMINASEADVVWCGLGAPRQEVWMQQLRDRLEPAVLVGVGAAFDFHGGLVRQAPPWMQERGLEWAYRLSREPRRLFVRYAKYNPWYVAAFTRQWLRERRR